uniref:Uncharacterized protein n=1 Tax=Oryza brachyantha TaxID=4533 RepID=J3N2D3_ORYBR
MQFTVVPLGPTLPSDGGALTSPDPELASHGGGPLAKWEEELEQGVDSSSPPAPAASLACASQGSSDQEGLGS